GYYADGKINGFTGAGVGVLRELTYADFVETVFEPLISQYQMKFDNWQTQQVKGIRADIVGSLQRTRYNNRGAK
ncbi:MAG: hypothetical protein FWD31_15435, partial [Planctomycetaceae bacterium]|nr:hypothetical protein [Planctomycetaceae bacterium]